MTSTTTRPNKTTDEASSPPGAPPRLRRRPAVVAAGAMVALASAGGLGWAFSAADDAVGALEHGVERLAVAAVGKRDKLDRAARQGPADIAAELDPDRLDVHEQAVVAVGLAGAVSFVAMAAPIVAGRLCGPTRIPVFGSALTGALLVIVADTVGRVAAPPGEVPVGVITSVIGGPFLLWVLLTDGRRRTD